MIVRDNDIMVLRERYMLMTWGGQREGSGRRPRMYKRVCRSFRLTDEEYQILKPLVEAIRTRTDASNKQHLEYLNN